MHNIMTKVEYELAQARNQQELDKNFERFEETEQIVKTLRKLHNLIRKSRIPKVLEKNKNAKYTENYNEQQDKVVILRVENFEIKYVNDICQDDIWEYTITYVQDNIEVIFKHWRAPKEYFYKNYIESLEIISKEKYTSKVKVFLDHITVGTKVYMKENVEFNKERLDDLDEIINKIISRLEETVYKEII